MTERSIKFYIPWSLVGLRVLLAAPAVYIAYIDAPRSMWLAIAFVAALSDLYDGKLARRWDVVSPGLRQADSIADTIFAFAVAGSLWFYEPQVVIDHAWGIGLVIAMELGRYPLDWAKFGRGASYHATSARVFGFAILVSVFLVIGFQLVYPIFWIMLALGVLSELEGIAMSLVLPEWTHDVKHIGRALEIRRKFNGTPS